MDLKAAYDAVVAANAETQQVVQQIEALFAEGKTDEALALRDEFNAKKAKTEELVSLYDDMAGVMTNDVAKKFVPAGKKKEEDADKAKVMTRAAFDHLTPKAQAAFVTSGGKLVDEDEEEK